MEETAMAVHRFFSGTIPIVLTGAQRPADDPHPDGPDNLRDAYNALSTTDVAIVFGSHTLPAYGTTKRHTTEDQAFAHTCSDTPPDRLPSIAPLAGHNVPIVTMFAGAGPELIPSEVDGLILAALGSGNVPSAVVDVLRGANYPITVCTRVPEGAVHFVYGGAGGGAQLERWGLRSGGSLRPSQARIELLCELAVQRATNPNYPSH